MMRNLAVETCSYVTKAFASGRWWPQPMQASSSHRRNYASDGSEKDSPPSGPEPLESKPFPLDRKWIEEDGCYGTPPFDLPTDSEGVGLGPVYGTPRKRNQRVYKVELGRKGQKLTNYMLYEDSMELAKVHWDEYAALTSDERDIYLAHLAAVNKRRFAYTDPSTGIEVMAITHHMLRGECCGNGCRHCPFEHKGVPKENSKTKHWNGAFYI